MECVEWIIVGAKIFGEDLARENPIEHSANGHSIWRPRPYTYHLIKKETGDNLQQLQVIWGSFMLLLHIIEILNNYLVL